MIAVGRADAAFAAAHRSEPMLAHQPFDALAIAHVSLTSQLLGHPRAAIASFVLAINAADSLNPQPVAHLTCRFSSVAPGVVAAAGDFQYSAQLSYRVIFAHRFDHLIALFYSSDRMPMVFFKMSRCMVTRANSLRSCWISRLISSAVLGIGASTGLAAGPYSLFQSRRFQKLTPNSCAICDAVLLLLIQ